MSRLLTRAAIVGTVLVSLLFASAHAALAADQLARIRDQVEAHNLTLSFKVCGYYCGPGWCSDQWIAESSCVSEGIWGIAPEAAEACTDGCCRWHDHCCGSGVDRASCNAGIVSCLDNNNCESACAWAVWAAMKVVTEWCCGASCPTYFDTKGGARQMSLAGKSFCSAESGLRLDFGPSGTVSAMSHSAAGHQQRAVPCALGLPYALNQTSNRVDIGTAVEDGDAVDLDLPADCETAVEGAKRHAVAQLRRASKVWYFPNTEELFVKNGVTKTFTTYKTCN